MSKSDYIFKYIYLHVCTLNNWVDIVSSIFKRLDENNAFDHIDQLRVSILGDKQALENDIWNFHPKIVICQHNTNKLLYEKFTLDRIRDDAINSKNEFYVFYLHSKGVTDVWQNHDMTRKNSIWRNEMIHAGFFNLKDTLLNLKHVSAIGTRLKNMGIGAHFSGNFWWSKSTHIKLLEPVLPKYLDSERWILSKIGSTAQLRDYLGRYINTFVVNKIIYAGDWGEDVTYPIFNA